MRRSSARWRSLHLYSWPGGLIALPLPDTPRDQFRFSPGARECSRGRFTHSGTENNQRRERGSMVWKKGRGKLGAFAPLLGTWSAEAESPQGKVRCQRTFSKVLHDSHIHLHAVWHIGALTYEEVAFFGVDREGARRPLYHVTRFALFTMKCQQVTMLSIGPIPNRMLIPSALYQTSGEEFGRYVSPG